jgi:hypothetical protein
LLDVLIVSFQDCLKAYLFALLQACFLAFKIAFKLESYRFPKEGRLHAWGRGQGNGDDPAGIVSHKKRLGVSGVAERPSLPAVTGGSRGAVLSI